MIIESAIRKDGKIYTGHRHHNIIAKAEEYGLGWGGLKDGEQGFVTNSGEFVNRQDAALIALACGQIRELKYSKTELFSEDLY